jgi:hypothetical protein
MSLVLWSLAFTLTLLALRGVVRKVTPLPAMKVIFLPGTLLAMASRGLACIIARAPIKAVHPPWSPGEPVEHEPPGVPLLGRLTLGLLPLVLGAGSIIALRKVLEPELTLGYALPAVEPGVGALGTWLEGAAEMVKGGAEAATNPDFQSWRAALFVYLAVSILVHTAPRLAEWGHVAAAIGGTAVFLALLDFLGLRAGWLSRGWYIRKYYGPVAAEGLVLLLTLALLTLASSALALAAAGPFLGRAREEARPARKKKKRSA